MEDKPLWIQIHQEVSLPAENLLQHFGGHKEAPTHTVPHAQFVHTEKKENVRKMEMEYITYNTKYFELLEDT